MSIIDMIESYGRERQEEALARANGYEGKARMHRDTARELLDEIAQELGLVKPGYWGGE